MLLIVQVSSLLCPGKFQEPAASSGRQTAAKACSDLAQPPFWEEGLWLSVHRWLSYQLLLFMVMPTGSVCISTCFPAPPGFRVPGNLPTAVPCRSGVYFFLLHTVLSCPSCLLLLPRYSIPISLGMSVSSILLWPLVRRNHAGRVMVIPILVCPA